ncbi:Putative peroxiredoxin bcp [Candidatus Magnetaquicoccaceae bacterium FCR-1]|uniref:thioredoxin-dependent peroxiredoxin n=1 Tax=Candidatus Magnetaquiglobus chichijimensis TaxID=3141448 RepID=A0ABQ0CC86_9PROT
MLQPGDTIPDLSAPDQNDQSLPLRQRLGAKGAVIYFYPKDNTPGCTVEANDFQTLGAEFAAKGFTVIGVSKDSIKSHVSFCTKYNLQFTLLSDTDGALCEAFGAWQEKKNYGKVYMGIVRSTFIVDGHGVVRKVYPSVKTAGHAAAVLGEVDRLSLA